uniref:Uncharacterized protein n=1 Tax=Glypta fumiferanae TaxID=389681 RepID=A0A0F6Q8X0_9HYME|nr:hypothetical protein [Glypta fumiferanae]
MGLIGFVLTTRIERVHAGLEISTGSVRMTRWRVWQPNSIPHHLIFILYFHTALSDYAL